eukprot:SM000053S17439  [mRNA]  locus=s53:368169:371669:- [translate_table: standard]
MTGADFCQFTGSFISNIKEMRIVRNDEADERYMVLMTFDEQLSADEFFRVYNGKLFTSMEPEVCHVVFTADVQYTESKEQAAMPPAGLTELPTCPVCLERLDQHISGLLTTVCNHTFHSACITKWGDSSCPVCRFCQQQQEKSSCTVCGTTENLWICLICGFVGCGRYKEGHAIRHWKDSQHCYSLELDSQRVWDYVGDGYVHRLIQSKTDGKFVELPAPSGRNSALAGAEKQRSGTDLEDGSCEPDWDMQEVLLDSKFEAMAYEYNHLLASQLESQRQYFEGLLAEAQEEKEAAMQQAAEQGASSKLDKAHAQLDKVEKEKEFLRQVNEALIKNQKQWQERFQEQEAREKRKVEEQDLKIRDLEEQVRDLMVFIEAQKTLELSGHGAELKDGTLLALPEPPAPSLSSKRATKLGRSRAR